MIHIFSDLLGKTQGLFSKMGKSVRIEFFIFLKCKFAQLILILVLVGKLQI